ncbi:hypothetical protein B0J13DRAFT_682534 [Dactylonectria estremocensis]|uniref:Protein kinase domain-containing protein n=1 Tax=Dactylonectria estremocensis TaxID=1079267 RepID=A0A9P9CX40_9HYPO|nr:hypothetical protein B0J13DRAFT_682534 [Dactylonectria estremocensis]
MADTVTAGASAADLAAEVRRSSQAVWAEGVDHGDERDANRLWNDERHRVMLVDFDHATLLPKKRKRQGDDFGNYNRKHGFIPGRLHKALSDLLFYMLAIAGVKAASFQF